MVNNLLAYILCKYSPKIKSNIGLWKFFKLIHFSPIIIMFEIVALIFLIFLCIVFGNFGLLWLALIIYFSLFLIIWILYSISYFIWKLLFDNDYFDF